MSRHGFTRTIAASVVAALLIVAFAAVASATALTKGRPFEHAPRDVSAIHVSATTRTSLYPGARSDALVSLSNPNRYSVIVTAISLNGTNAQITADRTHPGCTITGVSFTNQTGLHISVPAKSGAANGTARAKLSGAVAMSNASLNSCQGAAFVVPLTIVARPSPA
jgi:hypothetical protein